MSPRMVGRARSRPRSPEPKTNVTSRGDARAISAAARTPAQVSMSAITPILPRGRPVETSAAAISASSVRKSPGLSTLGMTIRSRSAETTPSRSPSVRPVERAFTRTQRIGPLKSGRAARTIDRAAIFWSAATASSRSRTIASAPKRASFSTLRDSLPGAKSRLRMRYATPVIRCPTAGGPCARRSCGSP